MPSLTDKLKDLGVQVGTSGIRPANKPREFPDLIDHLPGSWEKTPRGDCFVVRKTIPGFVQHGNRSLSISPNLSILEPLPALEGISEIPLSQILFVDTETTGLSGGAGTYVFLVGAAKIIDDQIEFVQFFLQEPASEPAQLAALEEFTADTKILVSYNGKSFDLPRIRNRFLFHGWPTPYQDIYHIDLLHIARRLWKTHLPGCKLGDLEHFLLDVKRDEVDIPGWQVSEKFFDYLQNRDPSHLDGVFYHNEVDVISLITLLSYITERLSNPFSTAFSNRPDQLSIGHFLTQLHQVQNSRKIFNSLISNRTIPKDTKQAARIALANIYKKEGDYKNAVPLWEKSASAGDYSSQLELAKYYEHKVKDYDEAIHWTLSAKKGIKLLDPPSGSFGPELSHRLDRLKAKKVRSSNKK